MKNFRSFDLSNFTLVHIGPQNVWSGGPNDPLWTEFDRTMDCQKIVRVISDHILDK